MFKKLKRIHDRQSAHKKSKKLRALTAEVPKKEK